MNGPIIGTENGNLYKGQTRAENRLVKNLVCIKLIIRSVLTVMKKYFTIFRRPIDLIFFIKISVLFKGFTETMS